MGQGDDTAVRVTNDASVRAGISPTSRVLHRARRRALAALLPALLLAAFFCVCAPAQAAQQYPFLGKITLGESYSNHYYSLAADSPTATLLLSSQPPPAVFGTPYTVVLYETATDRPYATWTGAATPAAGWGTFESGPKVAVDQSTGDVYVRDELERGYAVVDVFRPPSPASPSERYLCQFAPGGVSATECGAGVPAPPAFPPNTGPGAAGTAVDESTGDEYQGKEGNESGVNVFDPEGHQIGRIAGVPGERPFAENLGSLGSRNIKAIALDQSTHHLYLLVPSTEFRTPNFIYVFADQPVLVPGVSAAPAAPVHSYSAVLKGAVDPEGQPLASCRFEYETEAAHQANSGNIDFFDGARTVPCAESPSQLGSGTDPVAVEAEIGCPDPETERHEGKCLTPGTVFYYRLVAANANETPNEVSYGAYSPAETLETFPVPAIDFAEATEVGPGSATLAFQINPKGSDTDCRVQYGLSTSYEHTLPCEPEDLGEGIGDVASHLHLEQLSAGATYHWRVLAHSAAGATVESPDHTFVYLAEVPDLQRECQNEALRAENGSAALPDCRSYEQVTPTHKNGAAVGRGLLISPSLVSPGGSALIAYSIQAFAGAGSQNATRPNYEGDPFFFQRTQAGWQTTPLAPSATQVSANTPYRTDPETGASLFAGPTAPAGEDDFYLRRPDGSLLHIGPETDPTHGATTNVLFEVPAASADLSRFLYQPYSRQEAHYSQSYWPFDQTKRGEPTLYEYAGPAEHPFLVGVSGGPESTSLIGTCGTVLGGPNGFEGAGAFSSDGTVAYFTALTCSHGSGENSHARVPADTLYARIDGESADAHTVQISARSPSACGSACQRSKPSDALFEGASEDGTRVFFASTQRLTDEASEDEADSAASSHNACSSAGEGGCNLYLYDFHEASGHNLIDVSAGDTSGHGPRVQGVYAYSPDGSHVYFVAKGVLAANPGAATSPETGQPERAEAGADNLYLYQRDAAHPGGHTSFIASLPASEGEIAWTSEVFRIGEKSVTNVTPEGKFLVFRSHASLTPDDTRPEGPLQIYRYDAETERLTRVSIGQHGFDDNGNVGAGDASLALSLPVGRSDPTMSDDGARVFFTSPLGLTPKALNDVPLDAEGHYAQNVYEWEEDGAGACAQPAGCVYLISDGEDTAGLGLGEGGGDKSAVELLGASSGGGDVFFTSTDPLVPSDTDTQVDFYDARALGGFPAPARSIPCESSEACHGEGTHEPPAASPASAAFSGPEEGPAHPEKPKHRKKFHHKKSRHGKRVHHGHRRARAAKHRHGGLG